MSTIPDTKSKHIGRNIVRIRELRNIKQETLAKQLGITQQAVSKMEQSETIDEEKLEQIANALGVTVDQIKHFDEERAINNFVRDQNNHDSSINAISVNAVIYYQGHSDKVVELYERIIEADKQKIKELEEKIKVLEAQLAGK